MENKIMTVGSNPSIALEDLFAKVNIVTGGSGVIKIEMSGDEKSLKDIIITQKSADEILIKGKKSSNGNITIINSGGRSSISMNNFGSRGNCVIIGNGRVIVNGKMVSGGNIINTVDMAEPVQIKVHVPVGTNLDGYGVSQLTATGLNGKVKLSLSGEDDAVINGVTKKINVKCSGQSSVKITKAEGEVALSTSGQAYISVQGKLEDIEVDTSGQSTVSIQGECINITADSSGQSSITLSGKATGRVRQHSSGQSQIRI